MTQIKVFFVNIGITDFEFYLFKMLNLIVREFNLSELSKETDVDIFMLVEFLNSNGMELVVKGFFVSAKIPEALYNMALKQKFHLKELETLRKEELAYKIRYLKERLKTLEIISFGPDVMLEEKYSTALMELSKAEKESFLRENIMEEIDIESDDDDNFVDNSNAREYSIYNSFGFVTSTNNLVEARAMSIQFKGRIVDENGMTIY